MKLSHVSCGRFRVHLAHEPHAQLEKLTRREHRSVAEQVVHTLGLPRADVDARRRSVLELRGLGADLDDERDRWD